MNEQNKLTIYTIGHSTRLISDFVWLLKKFGITMLVDVRSVPRSSFNPQFNIDALPETLKNAGIGYQHIKGLGGLRHPLKSSPNTGWKNSSFRGFADYMLTEEFNENLDELIELAKAEKVAVMCAEALPWRCHRNLISDALVARGVRVEHIISDKSLQPHTLNPEARVEGLKITYPAREKETEKKE
ncbi:MAG: DUF488 domain-containing protein [Nitrospiraceae bacterium]|nr:DUF488 domain-containing protein [Nitrospiraceae bacterium]